MVGMNSVQQNGLRPHSKSSGPVQGKPAAPKPTSLLQEPAPADQVELGNPKRLYADDGEAPQVPAENSGSGPAHSGKGKDKTGKPIPPGLAKKKAADLPDGNPWKAALLKKEEETQAAPPADGSTPAPEQEAPVPEQTPVADMENPGVDLDAAKENVLLSALNLLNALLSLLTSTLPAEAKALPPSTEAYAG